MSFSAISTITSRITCTSPAGIYEDGSHGEIKLQSQPEEMPGQRRPDASVRYALSMLGLAGLSAYLKRNREGRFISAF